jgi:hypothetical protein
MTQTVPDAATVPVDMTPEQGRRAMFIADLYRMADYLAKHPEIPLDEYPSLTISHFPSGTDAEELAEVRRVADLLGVAPTPEHPNSTHIVAAKRFGQVTYRTVHVPAQDMQDWNDLMRIDRERKAVRRGGAR